MAKEGVRAMAATRAARANSGVQQTVAGSKEGLVEVIPAAR